MKIIDPNSPLLQALGKLSDIVFCNIMFVLFSIPIVTMIGASLTAMIGGSIVIERVFAWPGTGSFLIDSVQKADYPVVTGFLILLSFFTSISLLLVDIVYAFLDPRIKAQYTNK